MATDTASPSRNLWQLPTFLVGIAALLGVWFGRPYFHQTPAQAYESDLVALRQVLDKNPVDAAQVQTLLRKVYGVEPPSHLAQQAPFVLGSALVIIAESTVSPEEANEQWKTARKLLETAQDKGLADGDKLRHQFRLAKTWARTDEPPPKVIDALNRSLACGDDVSEGNRVLAEMYLKLEPPEFKKARDALKEYLTRVLPGRNDAQHRQLNQARLKLGELHLKLGESEDSRKVLERIGPDAPPELLIAARAELAKSYLADEEWAQAIRCLEQARDVRGINSDQKGVILYLLAESYLKAKRRNEAMAALDQLRKTASSESQAAALRLAEVQLGDPTKKELAVVTLESALSDVTLTEKYESTLLTMPAARGIFEQAAQNYRNSNAFDLSIRVARAYAKIAENGRDRELAAEALQAWGQVLLDHAVIAEPEDRPRLVDEGTKRLREAAKEWYQLSLMRKGSLEKGDPLYRAADLYLKAGDLDEALKMLDELGLKVPDFPQERLAEVWLKKGEVYLGLGNREQARICFQNGIQIGEANPSPALIRCRIRLAEVLLKSTDPKMLARAVGDLERALADPEFGQKDKELHENALLFVADAYYQQKEFRQAEVRFRTLLDNYPESPRATLARFQLGQCYWFIAGQEADKCKNAKKLIDDPTMPEERKREAETQYEASYKQYMEWLKKAAVPFKAVEATLLRGMLNPKLTPVEADILRKASLAAADCAFFSGEYDDCVTRYDAISQRYPNTVVQLEALKSMWRCYQMYLQKADKAVDTLTQMRTAYLQMPDSEFDGSTEVRKRDYWQRWFETVTPMKK